jgi:MerR family copper efflux transcriptional regulator
MLQTIGKLSLQADVGIETIRYYEREGLMPLPERSAAGYRLYNGDASQRLRFIRRSKYLGFSLAEIRTLLSLSDRNADQGDVKAIVNVKRQLIDEKIADLQRISSALGTLEDSCPGHGPTEQCPILNALNHEYSEN